VLAAGLAWGGSCRTCWLPLWAVPVRRSQLQPRANSWLVEVSRWEKRSRLQTGLYYFIDGYRNAEALRVYLMLRRQGPQHGHSQAERDGVTTISERPQLRGNDIQLAYMTGRRP